MNMLPDQVPQFVKTLAALWDGKELDCAVALAPPAPLLPMLAHELEQLDNKVQLAAQNCHWEDAGAHTGEVSPLLLKSLGVSYVILGHSERRQMYGETDLAVGKRAEAAIRHGLTAVVCVGESKEQYEAQQGAKVVQAQVQAALNAVRPEMCKHLAIAYEPVWAIGTGLAATPEYACSVHRLIRTELESKVGAAHAAGVRIIYGGSTKPENIEPLLSARDIHGALPGGTSLEAKAFFELIFRGTKAYWAARTEPGA